jgi:hypothetical protein
MDYSIPDILVADPVLHVTYPADIARIIVDIIGYQDVSGVEGAIVTPRAGSVNWHGNVDFNAYCSTVNCGSYRRASRHRCIACHVITR